MAAKPRSPVVDYAIYLLVRFFVSVIQALSWSVALGLADTLAVIAYRLDRRHRNIAADNLRQAFPERSADQIDQLVWASFRHLFTLLIEMVRLPRVIRRSNIYDKLRFQDPSTLEQAFHFRTLGRPIIVITGHFGNWEALSYATGLAGFVAHVIARRLDNPYLDAFLTRFRAATGQTILDKNTDFERIVDVLEKGGHIAALADQDAGPRGEFVTFFGRPASTFKSLALLGIRYDAILLVLGAARVGQCIDYRVYLEDVIDTRDYARRSDAVHAITQRYTTALEAMIRRHPEQYFWLHRRWKHQPKVTRRLASSAPAA